MKTTEGDDGREQYDPAPGFWTPRGYKRSKWKRDTAETMLEAQEYTPARPRKVNPLTLPAGQYRREQAFQSGRYARQGGYPKDRSHWHGKGPEDRTMGDIECLAAFELGWDTEDRKIREQAGPAPAA